MPDEKVYVRDDTLDTWLVFPSEQARRAYVQAATAVRNLTGVDAARQQRLRLLVQALGGDETTEGPGE